jgi:coproporphyrinogen III oxidase
MNTKIAKLLAPAGLFGLIVLIGATPIAGRADDEFAGLNSEQRSFAERTITFLEEMETLYFGTVAELNGIEEVESVDFPTEYAWHNVTVARGPVVEKAGRMRVVTKKPKAEFQDPTIWSRFFSVDLHPRSPLVGMIHAAFVIQYKQDGTDHVAGWIDILPGATPDEDRAYLKQVMDTVFEKYDIDPAPFRKMSIKGSPGEGIRRREPAGAGGSFYGRDLFPVTEQYFDFMTEAYREFLTAYLSLIEKHQDDEYTTEDLAKQDYMRRNWLEDRFFSDPYTGNVVPYEVWALSTLPPLVKF